MSPTLPDRSVSDVHAGATPVQLCGALSQLITEVAHACAELQLRPSGVAGGALLGFLDVSVTLPTSDVAGVDALADRYQLDSERLDPAGPIPYLYMRSGSALIADRWVTLSVSTARPGAPAPDLQPVVRQALPAAPPVSPAALPAPTSTRAVTR